MSGEPGVYTAGTPDDVKELRKKLISLTQGGLDQGATPYGGPLGTKADPGQIAAMNMLMRMSGNGIYSAPGVYSMPNQPQWNTQSVKKTPIPGGPGPTPVPDWKDKPGPMLPPGPPIDDGGINRPMGGGGLDTRALFQLINARRGMR